MTLLYFMIMYTIASYTSTPEDFLNSLCDNRAGLQGARFWVESSWQEPIELDSIAFLLNGFEDLSVEPGRRILSEIDEVTGEYTVEYPESKWSWQGENNHAHRAVGISVVIWSDGHYYWKELPLFSGTAADVGITERFITGLLFTVVLLVFGVLVLVWARRKYSN